MGIQLLCVGYSKVIALLCLYSSLEDILVDILHALLCACSVDG